MSDEIVLVIMLELLKCLIAVWVCCLLYKITIVINKIIEKR